MRLRLLMVLLVGLALQAPAEEISAPQLLEKMSHAARVLEYRGRLLYLHGSMVSTLELLHARFDDREHERLTQLDGQLAEVIRRGEHVVCVHADRTITRLVNRSSVTPLGLHERLSSALPVQYQLLLDGDDRIAGRPAHQLRLVPLDQFRYGYRLWTDQESGLLLKSELVDIDGVVLERLEFVSLELQPKLTEADFEVPSTLRERALDSLADDAHPSGLIALEAGWLPEGFVEVDRDLRLTGGARSPVAAATYSDGLAAFTLFVESLPENAAEGTSRLGPTLAISRSMSADNVGWLVTLVGEVPALTGERVLTNLSLGTTHD